MYVLKLMIETPHSIHVVFKCIHDQPCDRHLCRMHIHVNMEVMWHVRKALKRPLINFVTSYTVVYMYKVVKRIQLLASGAHGAQTVHTRRRG